MDNQLFKEKVLSLNGMNNRKIVDEHKNKLLVKEINRGYVDYYIYELKEDNLISLVAQNDSISKISKWFNKIKERDICVNRIIVEGFLKESGYKIKKEILSENGENPIYLEVTINSNLTDLGKIRLREYISTESNNDKNIMQELNTLFNSLPSEKELNANPIIVFWNED